MQFFNPHVHVERHGSKLPHWQQGEAMQFVTFRLADSLPRSFMREWSSDRQVWLAKHPQPWNEEVQNEYRRIFSKKVEACLDQGIGSCLLRENENRAHLIDAMMVYQGVRVRHEAWIIMPNHVHLLFQPLVPMAQLIKSWKGISARRIGQGSIWQSNYRDTLVRSEKHFCAVIRYIRKNPLKLAKEHYSHWESERAMRVD